MLDVYRLPISSPGRRSGAVRGGGGPGAPAVREALEVRKRWQQLRMAVVGAFDRADGDTVVGALEQRDRDAGANIARMLDGEVGARPGGVREPVDEGGVSHSHAELEAGHAGFGHPKDGGADLPALADDRGVQIGAGDGQVFPEGSWFERRTEPIGPPLVVLRRVGVDRLG